PRALTARPYPTLFRSAPVRQAARGRASPGRRDPRAGHGHRRGARYRARGGRGTHAATGLNRADCRARVPNRPRARRMNGKSGYAVFFFPQALEALGDAIKPYLQDSPAGPHLVCQEIDTGGALIEMTLEAVTTEGRSVQL